MAKQRQDGEFVGTQDRFEEEKPIVVESVCEKVRERWVDYATTRRQLDRDRAELAIRAAYEEAGLPHPRTILWAGSLIGGMWTVNLLKFIRASIGEDVFGDLEARNAMLLGRMAGMDPEPLALLGALRERVADECARPWAKVFARLHCGRWPGMQVGTPSCADGHWREVGREDLAQHAGPEWYWWGYHRAEDRMRNWGLLAQMDAYEEAEGLLPMLALRALMKAGVQHWWAFEHVAVLCEPPVEVHVRPDGLFGHAERPGLRWADGFVLHFDAAGDPVSPEWHSGEVDDPHWCGREWGLSDAVAMQIHYEQLAKVLDAFGWMRGDGHDA